MQNTYALPMLRKAYNVYLTAKHPKLHPKSVRTRSDDVFSIFKWMGEEEGWAFILDDGRLHEERVQFLADNYLSQRKNPTKDAMGYLRALREFREFIRVVESIERARIRLPRKVSVD